MDLYDATDGRRWTVATNWMEGDPCEQKWFGVTCDATNTSVIDMCGDFCEGKNWVN